MTFFYLHYSRFPKMEDSPDCAASAAPSSFVGKLILNEENKEGGSWRCCGLKIPRSLAVYVTIAILAAAVIITCLINLTLADECENQTLWFSILCFTLGFLIPTPKNNSAPLSHVRNLSCDEKHCHIDNPAFVYGYC